jgi:hypothetical protein
MAHTLHEPPKGADANNMKTRRDFLWARRQSARLTRMQCFITRFTLFLLVILLVGCFSKSDRTIPPEIAQANDLRQVQGWVLVDILENQTNSSAMSNFNEFLTAKIHGAIKKYHLEDQLHDLYVSTNRLKWENAINPGGGPDRTNVLMLLKVAKGFWAVRADSTVTNILPMKGDALSGYLHVTTH